MVNKILSAQKNEITEYFIYHKLALSVKEQRTREILEKIAQQEKIHYQKWEKFTGKQISPSRIKIWFYYLLSKIFGLSFGLRLMEKGEELAQVLYQELKDNPVALSNLSDEERHEEELIRLIDDKRLAYTSSFVLGLNDALVELTGALAGLTLALGNTRLIAMVGLITGLAASLSMAASSYLSKKEESEKNPFSLGLVTGFSYVITVVFLISPYFIFNKVYLALLTTMIIAIGVIFLFTFYTSVAKDLSFKKKFLEMTFISLGIALLNFIIGFLVKRSLGVE